MTLQVGDKVRVLETRRPNDTIYVGQVATVKEVPDIYCVFLEEAPGAVSKDRLEKIEGPTFKVGDRFKDPYSDRVITITEIDDHDRWPVVGKYPDKSLGGRWTIAEVEAGKVQQGVPFKLEHGDKVVNRKTGREGRVLFGPVSKELKVYDVKPSIQAPDAPPAKALEEYEFHFPGTYDLFKAKAQPW